MIIPRENVRPFAELLFKESFLLLFVSAVHIEPEPVAIYQFVDMKNKLRIRARVFAGDEKIISSISDIFHGAGWYEREIMEFFGFDFQGNPDKRTLILPEFDKGLHPLLKKEDKVKTGEDTGLSESLND